MGVVYEIYCDVNQLPVSITIWFVFLDIKSGLGRFMDLWDNNLQYMCVPLSSYDAVFFIFEVDFYSRTLLV